MLLHCVDTIISQFIFNCQFSWILARILFYILVDGFAQIVNGLLVTFAGGVDDAVFQMVLKDDFSGVVDGRAHRRNLHEHLRTISAILNHAPDGLQMADGAGKAVQNGLGVFVGMGVTMPVCMTVIVINSESVQLVVIVGMRIEIVLHFASPLLPRQQSIHFLRIQKNRGRLKGKRLFAQFDGFLNHRGQSPAAFAFHLNDGHAADIVDGDNLRQLGHDVEVAFRTADQRNAARGEFLMKLSIGHAHAVRRDQQMRAMEKGCGFGDLPQLDRPLHQLEAVTVLKTLGITEGIVVFPRIKGLDDRHIKSPFHTAANSRAVHHAARLIRGKVTLQMGWKFVHHAVIIPFGNRPRKPRVGMWI